MNLPFAEECARRLVDWLEPFSERISVAGSVRRKTSNPSDVDLVVIPKIVCEKDIFGVVQSKRNAAWIEIDRRISADGWELVRAGSDVVSFRSKGIGVDVFWSDASNWGTMLLSRTGSMAHNSWLSSYAVSLGGKWHPTIGLYLHNRRVSDSEEAIYRALGIDPIPPDRREVHLLPFSGLIRK